VVYTSMTPRSNTAIEARPVRLMNSARANCPITAPRKAIQPYHNPSCHDILPNIAYCSVVEEAVNSYNHRVSQRV